MDYVEIICWALIGFTFISVLTSARWGKAVALGFVVAELMGFYALGMIGGGI